MKRYITLLHLLFICQFIIGQSPIGHTTITFQDPERGNRAIETEIYYPAQTTGNDTPVEIGQFPVIVFGHGFVMSWDAYQNLWEEFVPRGYIMVFPRTEGSILGTDHQQFGWDLEYLVTEMQNEGANSNSILFNAVASETALMGHSMGGGAAFLAADSLSVNGNQNIKTLIGLAPAESSTNGVSSINSALSVTVPAIILSGSQDGVTPPVDHHIPMYDALASDCKTFINVIGGAHCYFANTNFNCDFGEGTSSTGISITREEQHEVTFDFVNLWLDYTLKSDCGSFAAFNDSLNTSTRVAHNQTCTDNPIAYDLAETVNICSGDNFTFPDGSTQSNITNQVIYTSNLQTTVYGCDSTIETTVNIQSADDASFSYSQSTFCASGTDPAATITGTSGGTYSIDNSGVINASTGTIDLTTSGTGNFNVTYTTNGTCPDANIVSITITTVPDAAFSYDQSSYCQVGNSAPIFGSGASAGVFTATPTGLSISQTTGEVDLPNSSGGTYTVTNFIAASGGCAQATTTQTIEVIEIDNSVSVSGSTLTANQTGAGYQWIDCNNSNQDINGETNSSYTAATNGDYAVEITLNTCIETSTCYNVTGLAINAEMNASVFSIYPNPTNQIIKIDASNETALFLFSMEGKQVGHWDLVKGKSTISLDLSPGVYLWKTNATSGVNNGKLIVE